MRIKLPFRGVFGGQNEHICGFHFSNSFCGRKAAEISALTAFRCINNNNAESNAESDAESDANVESDADSNAESDLCPFGALDRRR